MTRRPRVGIVGGYGAVGQAVAGRLAEWGLADIRIGGRRLDQARQLVASTLGGHGEALAVDLDDADDLVRFCEGCQVVVNCAGPSYRVLDSVARAALRSGASYVDAGGDDPVHELLGQPGRVPAGLTAVLSAGMAPGLTGLLPRWLAGQGFDEAHRLSAYVFARDKFTPAAAGDFLLSLGNGYGEPMAAWLDGRPAARALEPLRNVDLAYFSGRVDAYPYLSTETERLAAALGLAEIRWYNVFDADGQMFTVLSRAQAQFQQSGDLSAATAELIRAAEIDLFGRGPRQQFVMQLDGVRDGVPTTRTAVLRASTTYELSGLVTAVATRALLRGEIPPGVHFAADVLAPGPVLDKVRSGRGVSALEVVDGSAVVGEELEEGVL